MSSHSNDIMEATLKVRKSLINLQKELIDSLKDVFDKENGRVSAPGEWLQVLMVSQRYEWLRELTSLIADIDILTELQTITHENASIAKSEVERLFFHSHSTSEFHKHYRQLMAAGASFILTQGHLREATQKLPSPKTTVTTESAYEVRKAWHEEHKNQSRMRRS